MNDDQESETEIKPEDDPEPDPTPPGDDDPGIACEIGVPPIQSSILL